MAKKPAKKKPAKKAAGKKPAKKKASTASPAMRIAPGIGMAMAAAMAARAAESTGPREPRVTGHLELDALYRHLESSPPRTIADFAAFLDPWTAPDPDPAYDLDRLPTVQAGGYNRGLRVPDVKRLIKPLCQELRIYAALTAAEMVVPMWNRYILDAEGGAGFSPTLIVEPSAHGAPSAIDDLQAIDAPRGLLNGVCRMFGWGARWAEPASRPRPALDRPAPPAGDRVAHKTWYYLIDERTPEDVRDWHSVVDDLRLRVHRRHSRRNLAGYGIGKHAIAAIRAVGMSADTRRLDPVITAIETAAQAAGRDWRPGSDRLDVSRLCEFLRDWWARVRARLAFAHPFDAALDVS